MTDETTNLTISQEPQRQVPPASQSSESEQKEHSQHEHEKKNALISQYQEHEKRKRQENIRNCKRRLRIKNGVITILTILLLCVITAGAYLLYNASTELKKANARLVDLEIMVEDMTVKSSENDSTAVSDTVAQQPSDTLSVPKETPPSIAKATPVQGLKPAANDKQQVASIAKATPKQAQKPATNAKKQTVTAAKTAEYNKDPRVRTGAYVITGIERTVVLQKGQTLKSLSRAIFGAGMECYVEAVNTKSEYKEGDIVNIPALQLKKKRRK